MSNKIDSLVKQEALKSGVSSKNAARAIKMIKSGKVNMSQIMPHLQRELMKHMGNNNTSDSREQIRERIRDRIKEKREGRMSKNTKQMIYDRADQGENEKTVEQTEAKRKVNREKRLQKLEKRLGTVTEEQYNSAMLSLSKNEFERVDQKNRCNNIVEIYHRQQGFKESIKDQTLDDLLLTNDDNTDDQLSDLSDDD